MRLARLVLIVLLLCNLRELAAKSDFEKLGDVLTLAPLAVLVVSLGLKDYEGVVQLAAGALATQGTIELIKRGYAFAHASGVSVGYAKRPCCSNYQGMPSGHAGGSFSAAGFVYYRYGWKPALPLIGLGIITSLSRMYAQKHTLLQVVVGGAIAWGYAYLFTTKYQFKTQFIVEPDFRVDDWGGYYGITMSYKW